jgi:hypothetical protein
MLLGGQALFDKGQMEQVPKRFKTLQPNIVELQWYL